MQYPVIDQEKTGLALKRFCRARGLSVRDIQRYLGLASVQSVYDWFHAKSLPTVDNLLALSKLFEVPMEDLLVLKKNASVFHPKTLNRFRSYYYCIKIRAK